MEHFDEKGMAKNELVEIAIVGGLLSIGFFSGYQPLAYIAATLGSIGSNWAAELLENAYIV